jgi:general secretion pathway protein I
MHAKNTGFTLMEVMVAMSILAIALVAVFQMQSQSVSMSTESRFLTTASLLAQSKMADMEGAVSLVSQTQKGDFAPDHPDYGWSLNVADTQITGLKRVEVTVFNKFFADGGTYQLVFYKIGGM